MWFGGSGCSYKQPCPNLLIICALSPLLCSLHLSFRQQNKREPITWSPSCPGSWSAQATQDPHSSPHPFSQTQPERGNRGLGEYRSAPRQPWRKEVQVKGDRGVRVLFWEKEEGGEAEEPLLWFRFQTEGPPPPRGAKWRRKAASAATRLEFCVRLGRLSMGEDSLHVRVL